MRTMITLVCEQCGKSFERRKAEQDYRDKNGVTMRVMCSLQCSADARKNGKTAEQRKAEKAEYDRVYRKQPEIAKKHLEATKAFWKSDAGKAKRKARMHLHIEYCAKPEYKEKKKTYDQQYRAERMYGPEFAPAFLALLNLETEIDSRMTNHEIRLLNGTFNKKQERRRDYERINSYDIEERPLGDIERD